MSRRIELSNRYGSFYVATLIFAVCIQSLTTSGCFRDGQSCESNSIEDSKSLDLFVQSYTIRPLSNWLVNKNIDEVWIERECVIDGWRNLPTSGFLLRLSFNSETNWYANQRDSGQGLVKISGYGRWFDKSNRRALDKYISEVPLDDTLTCYVIPSHQDTATHLDSFLLVLDRH